MRVIDIGIPEGAPDGAEIGLIGDGVHALVPRRGPDGTKFTSGVVLVAGGSRGLTGAPCMAAEAAARAGAGYVIAAVPESLEAVFEQRLLEVMTLGLPDRDGALAPEAVERVLERAARAGALVLGPGLGRAEGAVAFARELARRAELPLLIDADGLNAHAGRLEDLAVRTAPTVLTPHSGELARLLGVDSDEVEAERLRHVREAARLARSIVLLKGDDTLIATPEGTVAVSRGGSPALATAGTGDVLAGAVGALLARGTEPFAAAASAVALHVRAGQIAAERQGGVDGVIAGDVVAALPAAFGETAGVAR